MAATSLNRVLGGPSLPSVDEWPLAAPTALGMGVSPYPVQDLARATETAAAAVVATLDRPSFATDTVAKWLDASPESFKSVECN